MVVLSVSESIFLDVDDLLRFRVGEIAVGRNNRRVQFTPDRCGQHLKPFQAQSTRPDLVRDLPRCHCRSLVRLTVLSPQEKHKCRRPPSVTDTHARCQAHPHDAPEDCPHSSHGRHQREKFILSRWRPSISRRATCGAVRSPTMVNGRNQESWLLGYKDEDDPFFQRVVIKIQDRRPRHPPGP